MPSSNKPQNPSAPDNNIEDGVTERQRKDQPGHIAQDATAPIGHLADESSEERPEEHGGQKGPEPTRYGDWEKKGRCTDF